MSRRRLGPVIRNWTERRALRATQTRLHMVADIAIEIGFLWGDEDQFIVGLADELRDRATEMMTYVSASVAARAEARDGESA